MITESCLNMVTLKWDLMNETGIGRSPNYACLNFHSFKLIQLKSVELAKIFCGEGTHFFITGCF